MGCASGPSFERGVIEGKLSQELITEQEEAFTNEIKRMVPSSGYLKFLKYVVGYMNRALPENVKEEYKHEIYGISHSAADSFNWIGNNYARILNYHAAHDIGHALQDKNMVVGCTSFGVWNKKTSDGKLLIGRNFDFFAGDDFATNKIVCFTKPKRGHKFVYITWAGFTGVVSGMNDKGLTVTINASKSDIPKSAATPISLMAKEILQYASTIDEAYRIALKRQTFVSESILIGSSKDKKSAIIEKTPTKTNLFSETGNQLICSNNFRSPAFEHDYINNKNILESSSLYRYNRMKQLLSETPTFTPEEIAKVLRNQDGINGEKLGLTNEKGINQLIAHHSVIFKPEEGLMWVSTSPYQLGKYVCYDLNKVFKNAVKVESTEEIVESERSIAADSFLYSAEYKKFLLFKQLKNYFHFCSKSDYDLRITDTFIEAFINSNLDSYLTYSTLGDYYAKIKNKDQALNSYRTALSKVVATQKEVDEITGKIYDLQTTKEL